MGSLTAGEYVVQHQEQVERGSGAMPKTEDFGCLRLRGFGLAHPSQPSHNAASSVGPDDGIIDAML